MENKYQNKELADLANMGNDEQHSDLKPYFECLPTGLYYHGVGVDKHGVTFPKPRVRIADPFRIVGRGQSDDEREYRIIEYQRNGRIYINDTVFEQEICKGFDVKFVCKVLRDCGWLVSESPQRNKMKITKEMSSLLHLAENTRMYCLQGFQPPETAEPA